MLVDLDMLLVAEFCQIQGPTVISSLPDYPCISGYTYRETERIISTLLLKVMSMNYPVDLDQNPLPHMYNADSYISVSYPLLSLVDQTDPDFFPDRHQLEQRIIHILHLSTFLPDISARGYVRKLSLLYLSFDAKKLDHMRFNLLFALNEALALLKYAATISTKIDLARYIVGLNKSIRDLDRVSRIVADIQLNEKILKSRLLDEGFSDGFISSVSFYSSNSTLTDLISLLKEFRKDVIAKFTLLRSETLPSIIIAVLNPQYAKYFSRPYLQLFDQREVAKLMLETLVLNKDTTTADIDAVYSPYLTQTISSILEHSPHLVLCNSHDLYVTAKQPLRRLEEYLNPLFLTLFKEIIEKIYGFYRLSLIDILSTEQCQNSQVILKFGEVFLFPAGELEDSLVFPRTSLHNNANILMDNYTDTLPSQFNFLTEPTRFLYTPNKCEDTYNTLLMSKWLFLHQYDPDTVLGSITWRDLAKEADLTWSLLDDLRRPCIHTFMHYNHESKIGHLLFFLYVLLSPRIFNNICTSLLQGKLLVVLCNKLVIAQILTSALSVFSAEILVQPVTTRGSNPYIHKERESIDCLKVSVELFRDLPSFKEYCLSISKHRGAKRAAIVVFCNDAYIPFSTDASLSSRSRMAMNNLVGADSLVDAHSHLSPVLSTRVDKPTNDCHGHDLYIQDLATSSTNPVTKATHPRHIPIETGTKTVGPSQSIFADASAFVETENSEYSSKDSVDFFDDLFEKLFIDKEDELCAALLATGDVKGLMILDNQIRYWPKEKINCSVVRSITVYFPGKGERNATSKVGVSNDFISRRLQNGMSKFFSLFLSGRHQAQKSSNKQLDATSHGDEILESKHDDEAEAEAVSPRSQITDADAMQRAQIRIKSGDALILPRFKAAFMQVDGASPEDIERAWNSIQYYRNDGELFIEPPSMFSSIGDFQTMPTLSANSGRSRAINDQTIYRSNLNVQKIMMDIGIDPIDYTS
ncbi:Hypothetical protein GLP15_4475 [Giardia lamblia P15]|uniref:Uncharacterized protein n=1 Tax=Giardia intestinalis (strain P15) TaxID=658858 RepID=E1F803_GIAIA|nr:Hypothetical protein GLP15_4475 [Giardia lamblia P15]